MFESVAEDSSNHTTTEYVDQLKARLQSAKDIVDSYTSKARIKQKSNYDKKAKAANIEIGDYVLVKILAFDGKHKLSDRFEEEPYKVIGQPNSDVPVFKVRSKDGKERVLHRNNLLPIGFIDNEVDIEEEITVQEPQKELKAAAEDISDNGEKEKDMITEEESDSEYSEQDFVLWTLSGGDARYSEERNNRHAMADKDEESERKIVLIEEQRVVEKDNVEAEVGTKQRQEQPEIQEDNETVQPKQPVVEHDHTDHTSPKRIVSIEQETTRKTVDHPERQDPVIPEVNNQEAHAQEEVLQDQPRLRQRQRVLPTRPTRRSERPTKRPKWTEDYCLNAITGSPVDRRRLALDRLLQSGLLNIVSIDVANRLWQSVLK
jgi:hypothetical protein